MEKHTLLLGVESSKESISGECDPFERTVALAEARVYSPSVEAVHRFSFSARGRVCGPYLQAMLLMAATLAVPVLAEQ